MEEKNMTALVCCFARAYHTKNSNIKIYEDNLAPSILARSAFTAKSIQRDKRLGLKQYLIFASGYDIYGYSDKELQCY